jgi:YVTN family beta-propeller protein
LILEGGIDMTKHWGTFAALVGAILALGLVACSSYDTETPTVTQKQLENRAYVVSLESDELTVIDLDRLEIIGQIPTGGKSNHMLELNADFTKLYVDSSDTNETIVIDARKLEVQKRIAVGTHPTHLSLSRDGKLLAIMAEDEGTGAVSFVDTEKDQEIKRLPGFFTPHFMRFAADGKYGYVANINAHHLTRVDLETLEIDTHIPLEGFAGPPSQTEAPDEGGFADAQIDSSGVIYAAHNATGKVLVYDTVQRKKVTELSVGKGPWIVFAEHPFQGVPLTHLVPNFVDKTISLINGEAKSVLEPLPGDEEAYGVNYTSLAPSKAFVMNRIRKDIAVVDTIKAEIVERIDVGGNTETASTTADGKYVVATVSGANRVVVLDAQTNRIIKIFENVGKYPWSVTIPRGQNYCH